MIGIIVLFGIFLGVGVGVSILIASSRSTWEILGMGSLQGSSEDYEDQRQY